LWPCQGGPLRVDTANLDLRRYIIFELKADRAEPEHLGKLSFYVTDVNDLLRRPDHGDQATIGGLLATDRDDIS